MNVNDVKERFDYWVNIPQQGSVKSDDYSKLIRLASYGLYNQRLGFPEQYDFQTAISRTEYYRTRRIHADMIPFKAKKTLRPNANGLVPAEQIPDDLVLPTAVRYRVAVKKDSAEILRLKRCNCTHVGSETTEGITYELYEGDVDLVEEDKWTNRKNSSYIKRPMWCPFSFGWEFHFFGRIQDVVVYYMKRPKSPVWAYTMQNGRPVYDPDASVDPEWDAILIDSLVQRMAKVYSRDTSDQMGMQADGAAMNTGE